MLARQACRQHAGDRKWHAVEIAKNALNLCHFSNNSRNCSGSRWLIPLAREVCRHRAGGWLRRMARNACGQADSPDRHAGGGACGRCDSSEWHTGGVMRARNSLQWHATHAGRLTHRIAMRAVAHAGGVTHRNGMRACGRCHAGAWLTAMSRNEWGWVTYRNGTPGMSRMFELTRFF